PKKGYHPPSDPMSYAAGAGDQVSSSSPQDKQFTLLDYNGLYNIVVWLEPTSGPIANPTPQNLPLASPNHKTVDYASPRIADVTPGDYRLRSWHYRLPGTSTNVTLAPGKSTKSTLVVGVNALPKVP